MSKTCLLFAALVLASCHEPAIGRKGHEARPSEGPHAAYQSTPDSHVAASTDSCGTLNTSDLMVAGIGPGLGHESVAHSLGQPLSRDSTRWTYASLVVYFTGDHVEQVHLTGRKYATSRGLRVGDTARRVTDLYGPLPPGGQPYELRVDCDGNELGLWVMLESGVVSKVIVGKVIDVD